MKKNLKYAQICLYILRIYLHVPIVLYILRPAREYQIAYGILPIGTCDVRDFCS